MTDAPAKSLAIPENTQQAVELLDRYNQVSALITGAEAQRDRAIAQATAAADVVLGPLLIERADLTAAIKPWWDANASRLADDGRKSITLGGCTIGYHTGNVRVVFSKGDDKVAGKLLADKGYDGLCRLTYAPDKASLRRALDEGGKQATALKRLGFDLAREERFFIDPVSVAGPGAH